MREFIIEWSTLEKTHFPNQVDYNKKILKAGQEYMTKGKFIQIGEEANRLYCPRKGIVFSIKKAIEQLKNRSSLPNNVNKLFNGWGNFITVDKKKYVL